MVFNILKDNKVYVNLKKWQFAQEKIEYLGHWISADGMEANPDKIMTMLWWSVPTILDVNVVKAEVNRDPELNKTLA